MALLNMNIKNGYESMGDAVEDDVDAYVTTAADSSPDGNTPRCFNHYKKKRLAFGIGIGIGIGIIIVLCIVGTQSHTETAKQIGGEDALANADADTDAVPADAIISLTRRSETQNNGDGAIAGSLRRKLERFNDAVDAVLEIATKLAELLPMPPSIRFAVDAVVSIARFFTKTPSPWERIENDVKRQVRTAITNYHEADLLGILRHCHERLNEFAMRAVLDQRDGREGVLSRKDLVNDVYTHYTNYVEGQAHLFRPSNFESVLMYDVGLFQIYFSFLSHRLVVLKLLESECVKLNLTDADPKYRPATWTEKLDELKKKIETSALPEAESTAKRLFWGDLNFPCETSTFQRLSCENVWSGEKVTYYWDVRLPIVDGTSPRTWDLYFNDADLGPDGNAYSCGEKAFFYYANGTFVNPGAYDDCARVAWASSGECRKLAAEPNTYARDGTLCGVSPGQTYLDAAQDLWRNFTAPTLTMIGKKQPMRGKNVSATGDPCLPWNKMSAKLKREKLNETELRENFCGNPDDRVGGPWCFTSASVRQACYDTAPPENMVPEGCLSPCRKYGSSYEWCITAKNANYPYGGSWSWKKCSE